MTIRIRIRGAHAELYGIDPGKVLPLCLSFPHPSRQHSPAYRRGDWDGMVELFSGRLFPAGLSQRVAEFVAELKGVEVEIVEASEIDPVDLRYLSDAYLSHPTIENFRLYGHQMGAIRAVLMNPRGIVKSPTGSGKSEMVIAVARYLYEEFGHRSLIVEPKKGVARQMFQRAQLYYGGDLDVGFLGEGRRELGPVIIATGQTLVGFKSRLRKGRTIPADPILREVVKTYEVLFYDECHHSSSETWYDLGLESHALRRYGFSGTPIKHNDLVDAKLEAVTGPIIYEAKPEELIEKGLAAKPKIVMVMSEGASGPELPSEVRVIESPRSGVSMTKSVPMPYAQAYEQGVVENVHLHAATVRATEWLVDRGRQTLVIVRRKLHFVHLAELFEKSGIEFLAVWGATDNSDRDHAKKMLGERKVNVVLATTIWDEGEDVPAVEALVLGEGVKVNTSSIQRIGRGMRNDSDDLWVVDFVPLCHPKLHEHAYERAKSYEGEGYEVQLLETWPAMGHEPEAVLLPFEGW